MFVDRSVPVFLFCSCAFFLVLALFPFFFLSCLFCRVRVFVLKSSGVVFRLIVVVLFMCAVLFGFVFWYCLVLCYVCVALVCSDFVSSCCVCCVPFCSVLVCSVVWDFDSVVVRHAVSIHSFWFVLHGPVFVFVPSCLVRCCLCFSYLVCVILFLFLFLASR